MKERGLLYSELYPLLMPAIEPARASYSQCSRTHKVATLRNLKLDNMHR
uniref:Uncharacterized protein n=1 Tax=Manihot esculenta TaxID=3983 RepID=A0A2C9W3Z3_MANES